MSESLKICAIGEALWDVYDDAKFLGGSPVNVAFHLQQAGESAGLVSRVGADSWGDDLIGHLTALGIDARAVQRDDSRSTGQVRIEVDSQGQPTFQCSREAAFDYLSFHDEMVQIAQSADAVYFDTLGQRHELARSTIRKFIAKCGHAVKFYDLNLTGWNESIAETVEFGLSMSDIVKLNQQELVRLHRHYASHVDDLALLRFLFSQYDIKLIALTRGAEGCLLVTRRQVLQHRGYAVPLVDATGCGDAFSAMLLHRYLHYTALDDTADDACRLAAFVATRKGATPAWQWDDLARVRAKAKD
jgi:fructokinase